MSAPTLEQCLMEWGDELLASARRLRELIDDDEDAVLVPSFLERDVTHIAWIGQMLKNASTRMRRDGGLMIIERRGEEPR